MIFNQGKKMHQSDYLDPIKTIHPDIKIDTVELIESGYHSTAVIINDALVFRFPLQPEFYDEYRHEKTILQALKGNIETQIPSLILHQLGDILISEHALIKGEQYSRIKKSLTVQQKDALAQDLAIFMAQIHAVKVDLPVMQFSANEYQLTMDTVKNSPVFSQKDRLKIESILTEFNTFNLDKKNAVLCHTDLNENNFLLQKGVLSGVIDFGNACVRDLSSEFAALLKWDFDLVRIIAKKYETITGKHIDLKYAALLQKIRCYGGMLECANNPDRCKRYKRWINHIETHELEG